MCHWMSLQPPPEALDAHDTAMMALTVQMMCSGKVPASLRTALSLVVYLLVSEQNLSAVRWAGSDMGHMASQRTGCLLHAPCGRAQRRVAGDGSSSPCL